MPIPLKDIPNIEDRARDLVSLIEDDIDIREDAVRQIEFIRNLYYGFRAREYSHEGQGDIHLPILAEKIEGIVSKEETAFWASEPHAHAQRVPVEFDKAETDSIERLVNWAVETDIPNFYQTFGGWLRNRHLEKVSVVKTWYNHRQRMGLIVEEADLWWRMGSTDLNSQPVPQDRLKLPAEVLASLFSQDLEIEEVEGFNTPDDSIKEQPLAGMQFLINFSEDHVDYFGVKVEFIESRYNDKVEAWVYRPIDEKDNVEVDLVDFEDIIVPYRTKDLQTAERVAQKYWLTLGEVEYKRQHEGWIISDKEMELMRRRGQGDKHEEMELKKRDQLKKQRDIASGQRRPTSRRTTLPAPYQDDKVLVFEIYARDNISGTSLDEEVIYQIPYGIKKIVKAQYLEEVFPHGRRPFSALYSVPIGNRWYGWSLAEFLAPINLEANVIINSVNDAQELINNPFFFYVPHAFPGNPKILKNIQPGDGIPVSDVNSVLFPKFMQEPLANLSAMDSMLLFADRLTLSPQSVGSSQVRNSPRTARGTLALLSEAGIKVDSFIMAAQKGGWAELMYQIYSLYDYYASDETWEAVTGRAKPKRSSTKDLRGRVEFVFKGNSVNTNREVRRALAQVLYNTLSTNPLYASDPHALQALTKNFLDNFQEGAGDITPLIPKIAGEGAMRPPLDQKTENQMMMQGMPLDIHPFDDDTSHLKEIEGLRSSRFFDSLPTPVVALVAAHAAQHQRALVTKQSQGQVSGGSQANNVPINTGNEMGDLEGGPR